MCLVFAKMERLNRAFQSGESGIYTSFQSNPQDRKYPTLEPNNETPVIAYNGPEMSPNLTSETVYNKFSLPQQSSSETYCKRTMSNGCVGHVVDLSSPSLAKRSPSQSTMSWTLCTLSEVLISSVELWIV